MQENSKSQESGFNERICPSTLNAQGSYNCLSQEAEMTPLLDSVSQRMKLGTDEDINWLSESECLVRQTETYDDCEYGQVCYPTSLEKIFECVKSFSQLHMKICSKSPQYVKEKAPSLNISSYISEACKQYYIYSAQKSGLLNDDHMNIIRFQPIMNTGLTNSPDQIPNEDYMNAMLVTPHSSCKRKFDDVDAEKKGAVLEI